MIYTPKLIGKSSLTVSSPSYTDDVVSLFHVSRGKSIVSESNNSRYETQTNSTIKHACQLPVHSIKLDSKQLNSLTNVHRTGNISKIIHRRGDRARLDIVSLTYLNHLDK
jgi:hypothetical protein